MIGAAPSPGRMRWLIRRTLKKLVIINAPHPGIFTRLLAQDPAQQKASQYMLMFRSPQAETTLSANNYGGLVQAVLGPGLKTGAFTEEDKQEYIKAWSQPGGFTGGLNYYRAAKVGPPATADVRGRRQFVRHRPGKSTVKVPTLVWIRPFAARRRCGPEKSLI